jgi:aspartate aminotransferase
VLGKKTPDGRALGSEQDFALYLLDNGVAGIQGEAYGLSPYLRFSIATDLETLQEACRRIQRACAALS